MKTVDYKQIEYEVTQAKKALLEHFEIVIQNESVWTRSRKKILDVMGEDGLMFRIRNLFGMETKERNGNVI